MNFRSYCQFAAASMLFTLATSAPANVIIDYVPVGDAGNVAAKANAENPALGGVPRNYAIGRTEVTNRQYAGFLNAVDPTGVNTLGLYDARMSARPEGGITFASGNAAGSVYATKDGRANQPVVFVSWYDAVRFTNWLHNGQPAGGGTEAGTYTLTGGAATPANGNSIVRNAGATFFLPTDDEWYKAAYYKGGSPDAGYWTYPTRTDVEPTSARPPGSAAPIPGNTANFKKDDRIANGYDDGYAVTGTSVIEPEKNHLSDVGAYPLSTGPYGTLDQGGNVAEWTEQFAGPSSRKVRGGGWTALSFSLHSYFPLYNHPTDERADFGFRVATVPEPAGMSSALAGLAVVLFRRSRRA